MAGGRRWLVIILTAAAFAGSALAARRLHLDEDITALLPDADPVTADYRYVVERFKAIESLFIDVGPANDAGATSGSSKRASDAQDERARVSAIADALHAQLVSSDMFRMISYRASPEGFLGLLETVNERKGCLITEADMAAVEGRLATSSIEARLAAARKALIGPSGLFVRDQIRRDPLGFDEVVFDKMKGLAGQSSAAQVMDGRIWSRDGRHILMIASPKCRSMDTTSAAALNAFMDAARDRALRAAPDGAARIAYVGGHRASVDNARAIKSGVSMAMGVSAAGILLLAVLFFRSALYIPLMLLPPAFGLALAAALFGIVDPTISAISIGVSAVLAGVTVDCAVHIIYRLDNSAGESLSPYETVRAMLLPLLLVSGTTVVGVLCLLFSSLPGQRQTAFFAAVCVTGATLYAAIALPSLLPSGRRERRRTVVPLVDYCRRFLAWRERNAGKCALAAAAALALSAWGASRLEFDGDANALNYLRPANHRDDVLVRDVWGDFAATVAVVKGRTLDEALAANDRLHACLDVMAAERSIASVSSIAPILPSRARQEANRRRWREYWTPERRAALEADLARAAASEGFAAGAFAPFTEGIEGREECITEADFAGSGLDSLIGSRIARDGEDYLVMTTFAAPEPALLEAAEKRIKGAVPGAIVMNGKRFVVHTTQIARGELGRLAVVASCAVALFIYFSLGSIELVLLCMAPVYLSVLMTLGTLGFLGIPINLVGSLFIVFVFGVGIDYSIFLVSSNLDAYRGRSESEAVAFGSVIIAVLSTLCSFAALCFAAHPALFSIGITGSIGMASSLLCAAVLVPPMAKAVLPAGRRFPTPSLAALAGGIAVLGHLAAWSAVYVAVLRPAVRLLRRSDIAARQRFARRYFRAAMSSLNAWFPYLRSERVFVDAGPEAFAKPCVIVSNHLALVDIFAVLCLPADLVMVVRGWVWRAPVMGLMVRDAGYILAGGDDDAEDVLAKAAGELERGASVVVFPEGHRSPDAYMRRFHKGAFELAVRTGADVLPVLLTNTQACCPRGGFWIGDHKLVVRALPRVTPADFDYSLGSSALGARVKETMLAGQAADWRLAQEGPSFPRIIRSLYNYHGVYAESYIAWKLRLDPIYGRVSGMLPVEGDILDLGCGYGLMSNILARKSLTRRVLGVDVDERRLTVAARTFQETGNVTFELRDIAEWQYPAADGIVLVDVLHYWPAQVQAAIIARAAAALRPGGRLVFREALASGGWRHAVTEWSERFSNAVGHNRSGSGLHFLERSFYVDRFRAGGLSLVDEPADASRGSNAVMVWGKA